MGYSSRIDIFLQYLNFHEKSEICSGNIPMSAWNGRITDWHTDTLPSNHQHPAQLHWSNTWLNEVNVHCACSRETDLCPISPSIYDPFDPSANLSHLSTNPLLPSLHLLLLKHIHMNHLNYFSWQGSSKFAPHVGKISFFRFPNQISW